MKLQLPYHYLSITLMRDKCQVSWNQRKMPLNVGKKTKNGFGEEERAKINRISFMKRRTA